MGSVGPTIDAKGALSAIAEEQLLFIDGQESPALEGITWEVNNPMTGRKLYSSAGAGAGDYERAIEAADKAFTSWSSWGPSRRRQVFLKAADILERYLQGAAPNILASEVSATNSWIKVNILATANIFRETASLATQIKGEIIPADRPGTTIMVTREAIGVVFAISPWNAPVSLFRWWK